MVFIDSSRTDLLHHRRPTGHEVYRDAIWHYIVREWRRDGPDEYLAIVTNGCTDNINQAFRLCNSTHRPRHVLDTRQDKIIHRNY